GRRRSAHLDSVRLGNYRAERGGRNGGPRVTSAETQIASFFAKYDPATAKLGKSLRAKLRDRLPGLLELVYVYESQNGLVISYSPTETGSDAVCALALYPRLVKLFF